MTIPLRRLALAATGATLVLALAACATPKTSPGGEVGSVDVRGEWSLTGATVDDTDVDFGTTGSGITIVFADGSARIRTGCITYDQPMTDGLDFVTASYVSQPQASCMGLPEDVSKALARLADVTNAARDGESLTMTGEKVTYTFDLVPAATASDVEGTWTFTGVLIGGDAIQSFDVDATLTFGPDGKVSGKSGCNSFGGTYTLASGNMTFGDLVQTMMACDGPAMDAEAAITAVMGAPFVLHVADGTLQLISSTDDSVLMFSKGA